MPLIEYVAKSFSGSSRNIIDKANKIVEVYQEKGFKLTLRQLYYQFVSHDLFPEDRRWRQIPGTGKWIRDPNGTINAQPNYKWLGDIINDARLAGLVDWDAMEDRTRELSSLPHWESPTDILSACAQQFRIDVWEDQAYRPEVWIEKDALAGVIEGICKELRVSFLSCRGYTSQSEMWGSAQRLMGTIEAGQTPVILHFGDHDPSGIDMSRDIQNRLALFGAKIEFKRLALNMPQIEQFNPPPNPAKTTDARFKSYRRQFGDESWELDALDPEVLANLIRDNIMEYRDERKWREKVAEEEEHRRLLRAASDNWDEITEHL